MNNYYLFLDDERIPSRVSWVSLPKGVDWVIVRNYEQFVDFIDSNGLPVFVTYDHDLADQHYSMTIEEVKQSSYEDVINSYSEKTGYDCAKWLVQHCLKNDIKHPSYSVHSLNPIGKQNIESLINSYNRNFKI
jgi:hypothetical protein